MDWNWIWQGLASSLLWELVLMCGGAVILERLRAKRPDLANRALFVLAGIVCIAVLIFTVTGRPLFSKNIPVPTDDDMQDYIFKWSENLGFSVQRMPDDNHKQGVMITTKDGVKIVCGIEKDLPHYLEFAAGWDVSQDQVEVLNAMNPEQKRNALNNIDLELARSQYSYSVIPTLGTPMQIDIRKLVPVDRMDEYTLLTNINNMKEAIFIARRVVEMQLQRPSISKQ